MTAGDFRAAAASARANGRAELAEALEHEASVLERHQLARLEQLERFAASCAEKVLSAAPVRW